MATLRKVALSSAGAVGLASIGAAYFTDTGGSFYNKAEGSRSKEVSALLAQLQ